MQFKFLAALLLVGACFAQVSLAHPSDNELQRSLIDDLIAQAKKEIEKLQKSLELKIQDALKQFEQLKDQISKQALEAIEALKQKLNVIIAAAQKQIDEIKQKAEELGINISKCLADNEAQFEELFNKLLQDAIQCIQTEIDKVMKIVNEAIQIVTDAIKTVQDLPEKLKACGTGITSVNCIKNIILKIAKLAIDLPAQITKKINEVTQFVGGLQSRLEICAISQLTNAGIAAAGIVVDVGTCAANQTAGNFQY